MVQQKTSPGYIVSVVGLLLGRSCQRITELLRMIVHKYIHACMHACICMLNACMRCMRCKKHSAIVIEPFHFQSQRVSPGVCPPSLHKTATRSVRPSSRRWAKQCTIRGCAAAVFDKVMSRGDKRERDRAKAEAKQQAKLKSQGKGGDPLQRNANDAAALQAKVAAKKAQEEQQSTSSTSSRPVPRKKVEGKKKESVDDLLNAGLSASKKNKRAK